MNQQIELIYKQFNRPGAAKFLELVKGSGIPAKIKDINNYQNSEKPVLFQIMNFDLPLPQKNQILKNYLYRNLEFY